MVSACALEFMMIHPLVSLFANYIIDKKGLKLGVISPIKIDINQLHYCNHWNLNKNANRMGLLLDNGRKCHCCNGKHFRFELSSSLLIGLVQAVISRLKLNLEASHHKFNCVCKCNIRRSRFNNVAKICTRQFITGIREVQKLIVLGRKCRPI